MKLSTPFLFILAAAGLVQAIAHDDAHRRAARHHGVQVARDTHVHNRRANSTRCKVKAQPAIVSPTEIATSTTQKPTTTKKKTSTKSNPPEPSPTKDAPSGNGVIHTGGTCYGDGPHASKKITHTNGPNGKIEFLNCGIEGDGWAPPQVYIEDLVVVNLDDALKDDQTPYKQCGKYLQYFDKYAQQFNIPAIFLAAFAMQESGCNEYLIGGAGEVGMMQITRDKCQGLGQDECMNPDNNIRIAAEYFSNSLRDNGYNVLKTVGAYNGFFQGMTKADALRAKAWNCHEMNNLDYLMQFFNAWILNKNAYGLGVGLYFNLAGCN